VADASRAAAALGLDPLIAVGHSAGGHLALWLAGEGLVDAAISLAGVSCLVQASPTAGPRPTLSSGCRPVGRRSWSTARTTRTCRSSSPGCTPRPRGRPGTIASSSSFPAATSV
jgi:pimeloyl-ACP methyl ester carboxylesterase